ncbi:hypothetical protein [Agromyces archimandritae]|uniref:Uncharacterized protein n=1 Tax=Agromyces archimandritae TaxID=2781962 RepID=A0A975FRS9_9MICO|nr:hypothetical protein [Agromyces archimandritae]QTX06046.1 hypothetical protein G127AT_07695 [Agromyces archimandritae]
MNDPEWMRVLAHRVRDGELVVRETIARFEAAGVTPGDLAPHLADGGDRLYAAAAAGDDEWADAFGGLRSVALIAAEVGALMSHLVARAASIRGLSIDGLLDEYSAVTVAEALGVARQKVYGLAKPHVDPDYLERSPWSGS